MFVTEELLEKMLARIELLKQTDRWQKESGRYVPSPLTWLERQGWNDPVPQTSGRRKTPQEIVDDYDRRRTECEAKTQTES